MPSSLVNTWLVVSQTINVNPVNVGDVLCVGTSYTTGTISLSGGGVTTWIPVVGPAVFGAFAITTWYGVVTAAGPSTIATGAGPPCDIVAAEFGIGVPASWALVASNAADFSSGGSDVPFPTLTSPTPGSNAVYFGTSGVGGVGSTSPGSGATGDAATYVVTGNADIFAWIANLSGSVSEKPVGSQSSATDGTTAGMILNGTPVAATATPADNVPHLIAGRGATW